MEGLQEIKELVFHFLRGIWRNRWIAILVAWPLAIGGVAVVASLVYVGLQVRQHTQVTRGQAITTLLSGQIAGEVALMGDDGAAALANAFDKPADMSTVEIAQVWAYLYTAITSVQTSYELHTLGLASRRDWERARTTAPSYLGFPFGQAWWSEIKDGFPADFVAEIEDAMSEGDRNSLKSAFDRVEAAASQLAAEV